jgi:hypothetical protein
MPRSNHSPTATRGPPLLRRWSGSNFLIDRQRKVVTNFFAVEILKSSGIAVCNRDPLTSPVHEHLLLPAHRTPQEHLKHLVPGRHSACVNPAALPLHKGFSDSAPATARNDNTIPTHFHLSTVSHNSFFPSS